MDDVELPVLPSVQPKERADAVANRQRILDAATRLFNERGVGCTSMDDIAVAAGVGKGTVFRRFGDRASLAMAVLDVSERMLQEAVIRGPAPLGPGAPPRQRLVAFGGAMYDRLEEHHELLLDAEMHHPGGSHLTSPPHAVHHTHVRHLLSQLALDADLDYLADVLLLPLAASTFTDQRRARGMELAQLKASYAQLVGRLTCESPARC